MSAGAADDDGLLADIIAEALEAIAATDEAPSPDDEGEDEGAEAGSGAARGAGRPKSWGQWERFSKRVAKGKAYASCVIDFAFTDGGRLPGSSAQLERMYCFHDPATTDDTLMLDVVHAHTTALWKDRRSLTGRGRPLSSITSVNARYGRRSDPAAGFQQDRSKLLLVPKNAALRQQWRSLPESYLVWGLDDDSVPPLDAGVAARYESVRRVLRAGEAFCQDAELAYSYSESNARMRGTTKRDGQEVEYEVVACTRKARKDLRVGVDADDPAAWQNLRAAVLCIGLGEYKHLPVLPNATRDARALCEKVNALPHCRALLLADLPDPSSQKWNSRLSEAASAADDAARDSAHQLLGARHAEGWCCVCPATECGAGRLRARCRLFAHPGHLQVVPRGPRCGCARPGPAAAGGVCPCRGRVPSCRDGPFDAVELARAAACQRAQEVGAVLLVLARFDGVGRAVGVAQPVCTGAAR